MSNPRVWVQIIPKSRMGKAKREGFNVSHKRTRTHKNEYVHIDDHLDMIAKMNRLSGQAKNDVEIMRSARDGYGLKLSEVQKELEHFQRKAAEWEQIAHNRNEHAIDMENTIDEVTSFLNMVGGKSIFYCFRAAFRDACAQFARQLKEAKK